MVRFKTALDPTGSLTVRVGREEGATIIGGETRIGMPSILGWTAAVLSRA